MTNAALKQVSSSSGFDIICNPIGSPSLFKPDGTDIAGKPAKLAGTVNISFKYISKGSSCFSPIPKAAPGVVGVKIQSHFSNALEKSFEISLDS